MAIAMAQAGGIGVIHRNLDPGAAGRRRSARSRSSSPAWWSIPSPSIREATLADALALMQENRISGIPVVEPAPASRRPASWSASSPTATCASPPTRARPVAELMTKERLVTVREGVGQDEAKRLLHQHRIEKLLVVDDHYRCVGLITVKDIEKAVAHPACLQGRAGPPAGRRRHHGRRRGLRAHRGADRGRRRPRRRRHRARPFQAGCSTRSPRIKRLSNAVQVVAGNIATARRRQGADRRRRRRHQGRHRAGLDLHHAHRRRRRRAAAHRHHGCRRGGAARPARR